MTNKKAFHFWNAFCICKLCWLEMLNLFLTFEDLESVKDKHVDIKAIQKLLASKVNEG